MIGNYTTDAIVLGSIDYGESDRIVTFYTIDYGKVKGIAKGAKRSKHRFVNNLEPFSCIKLLFFQKQGRELVRIEQADILQRFDNLLLNLERLAQGSYCLELLNEMTPDGQKNEEVFELLRNFLERLDTGFDPQTLTICFEIKLLSLLGYYPHLDACVVCKQIPAQDEKLFFSSDKSGMICPRCKGAAKSLIPISLGTVKFFTLAARTDIDKVERLQMPPWAMKECRNVMDDFVRYQLGKELKSKRFLEKIKAVNRNRVSSS